MKKNIEPFKLTEEDKEYISEEICRIPNILEFKMSKDISASSPPIIVNNKKELENAVKFIDMEKIKNELLEMIKSDDLLRYQVQYVDDTEAWTIPVLCTKVRIDKLLPDTSVSKIKTTNKFGIEKIFNF